jgi:hypothetical protein
MNVNTVYINGEPVGQCTSTQIRPTVAHGSLPEYDVELIEFVYDQHQPQLDENQHVVFDWAKSYLSEAKNIMWFIEELAFLSTTGGKMRYKQVAYTYESLSDKEKRELLSALMAWALEQEAE